MLPSESPISPFWAPTNSPNTPESNSTFHYILMGLAIAAGAAAMACLCLFQSSRSQPEEQQLNPAAKKYTLTPV